MSPVVQKTTSQPFVTEPSSAKVERRKASLTSKENEAALTSLRKDEDALSSQTIRKTSNPTPKGSLRNLERVPSDPIKITSLKSPKSPIIPTFDEESVQTKKSLKKEIVVFKPTSSFKDKEIKRFESNDDRLTQNLEEKFQALMEALEEYGKAKGLPLRAEKESLKRTMNSILKKH
jgi:hypothetical protein